VNPFFSEAPLEPTAASMQAGVIYQFDAGKRNMMIPNRRRILPYHETTTTRSIANIKNKIAKYNML
jgi:hypothetical protein